MIQDNTNTNLEYLDEPVVEDGELNAQGVFNVVLSFYNLVRNLYVPTEDTTPVSGKTYYKLENGKYVETDVSSSFPVGVTFYEKSREKEAILFNQYYELAQLYCCRIMDWSFLMTTKTYEEDDCKNIETVTDVSNLETGVIYEKVEGVNGQYNTWKTYKDFKYQFKLPEDCLKIKYINGSARNGFAIKGNTFYCNYKAPNIDYITTTLSNIPLDFGYLVAYRVAIEMSSFLDSEVMAKASNSFTIALQTLKANEDESFRIARKPDNYYTSIYSDYWKELGVVPK